MDRTLALVPLTHRVLDIPCGGGRVALHLARKGYAVAAADWSDAMLEITRESMAVNKLNCPVEKQDVEKLTFADQSFDTVICFRLFHHFPTPEIRQRVVSELCRVTRKYVALPYFSPLSPTSLKRITKAQLSGRTREHFPTSMRQVKNYFAAQGFCSVKDFAPAPFIHTLRVAVFERNEENKP